LGLDSEGNLYVTGYTAAYDFPVTTGAWRTANTGVNLPGQLFARDGFALRTDSSTVMQLANGAHFQPSWQVCTPTEGVKLSGDVYVTAVFQAEGTSPSQVKVDVDGKTIEQLANQSALTATQSLAPGTHTVTLLANSGSQTVSRTVTVEAGQ